MPLLNEVKSFIKNNLGFIDLKKEDPTTKEEDYKTKGSYWSNQILGSLKIEEEWRDKALSYYRIFRGGDLGIVYSSFLNTKSPATIREAEALSPRFNIFYSNTETLKSILLPKIPRYEIRKRFDDDELPLKEDNFYNLISETLDKTANFFISKIKLEDFNKFKYDYLITGRAILWISYKENEEKNEKNIAVENVNFNDFLMSPAQSWEDVWWIARRKFYTKPEFKNIFPDVNIDKIKFAPRIKDKDFESSSEAEVWEIWDKSRKKILYWTPSYQDLLGTYGDIYKFKNFFPTACPLYSIYSPINLTPVPEFDEYKQQAADLSNTSLRISKIINRIKCKAFYRKSDADIVKNLLESDDNEYIGIDSNSLLDNIPHFSFMPIKEKQDVVIGLQQQQRNLINEIYEITGISDIMRNVSSAETATLTNIRTRFGTSRLQQRQAEINEYFKNTFGIMTELICAVLETQDFKEITNLRLPERSYLDQEIENINIGIEKSVYRQRDLQYQLSNAGDEATASQIQNEVSGLQSEIDNLTAKQKELENTFSWDDMIGYLKEKKAIEFIVDIETDFSLENSAYEQQRQRIEIYNTFITSVNQLLPMLKTSPSFTKIMTTLFRFTMDSFKLTVTQRLELDEAIDSIQEETKQEIQSSPDPALIKAQAELMIAQARQAEAEVARLKVQAEIELNSNKEGRESRVKEMEFEIERQKNEHEQNMAELKMSTNKKLADIKEQETLIKARAEEIKSRTDLEISEDKLKRNYLNRFNGEGI